MLAPGPGAKADEYWNGSFTTGGPVHGFGGSGFWDTTTANWLDAGGDPLAYDSNLTAHFAGTAGTVTLGENITFTALSFDVDGYSLESASGLALTSMGAGLISAGVGVGVEIDTVIAGTAVDYEGGGTITVTNPNTYTGGTTIGSATTLLIGYDGFFSGMDAALGDPSGGLTFDGGTLRDTTGVTDARNITLNAGGGTISVAPFQTTAFNGTIGGAGKLTVAGTGTVTVTGNNTYLGGTDIGSKTILNVASDANLGDMSGGVTFDGGILQATVSFTTARAMTINIGAGGLQTTTGITMTVNGAIGGVGELFTLGAGTVVLGGTNTYQGGTDIGTGSTLSISSDTNLGAATSALTFDGGTLVASASLTSARSIIVDSGGGTLSTAAGNAVTLSGVISGSGEVTMAGGGTFVLSGTNTHAGGTDIGTGTTVVIASDSNLGNGSAALTFDGGILQTTANLTDTRKVTLNAGGGTISPLAGATLTMSGAIGGVGGLTMNGAGTLVLSGANTYTGTTTIASGTLQTGAANTIPIGSAVLVNAGATLSLNGNAQHVGSIADGAGGGGAISLGSATLTAGNNNTSTTFSGVLSGTGGGLTKAGTGTLTLTGTNTYTGATSVTGGTLAVTPGVLSSASALAVGGGTFLLSGVAGTATTQILNGLTVNAGSSEIEVNNNGGTTTTLDLRGTSGTLGIVRNSGGLVDFDAVSGALGSTVIIKTNQANDASGVLGAWATVSGGAALAMNNGSGVIVAYTGYRDINAPGPNMIPDNSLVNVRINGLGASVSVAISDPTTNINTLTQNSSTDSMIDTSRGELRVGAVGGLFITPGSAGLTVGTTPGSGLLTAGGSAINKAGEIIFENNSSSLLTVNSVIANNGSGVVSVRVDGTGVTVFNTANTYSGTTDILDGTLRTGAINAIPAKSPMLVDTQGTLDLNSISQNVASIADGTSGGGTVNLGSATLTTGSDNTNTTFSGVINGNGILTKVGTGTLTLSGSSSYSGGTNINGGTVSISNDSNLGAAGSPLALNGGTLASTASVISTRDVSLNASGGTLSPAAGTTLELDGAISGGGMLTKNGAGALFVSDSANTFSGGTTLNSGTLFVNGSIGDGSGTPLGTGTVTINGGTIGTTIETSFGTEGTILANAVSVKGNFAIATNVDAANSGAQNFSFNGVINLNGATRTISGITNMGQIHFGTGGIGLPGEKGGVVFASPFIQPSDYDAFIFDPGNTNNYKGLTTVGNGVFLVFEGNAADGAIKGDVLVQGTGVLDYLGGNASQIANTSNVTVNSSGNIAAGQPFAGLDLFNSAGDTIGSLSGSGTVSLGAGVLTIGAGKFTGVISDGLHAGLSGGRIVKNTTGTLILSGANTYTGSTIVSAGILEAGAVNTIPVVSLLMVSPGATLDLNGFNQSIDAIADQSGASGTIILGKAALTIGLDNSNSTFSGVIQDGGVSHGIGGSLIKVGSGTVTLKGNSTYTGATDIDAGELDVVGSLGAGTTVNVTTSGKLVGTGIVHGKATLTGNGVIDLQSGAIIAGTLGATGGSWTDSGAVDGVVTVSSGVFDLIGNLTAPAGLVVTGGTIAGTGRLTGNLTYSSSSSETFDGVIAGTTLTMNKAGSTLTLTGTNTYSGATTVSAGTLQLGDGATAGSSLGSGLVTVAGPGVLAVDLPNGAIFSGKVNLSAAGATLMAMETGTNTYSGVISGPGVLNQSGTGRTILTGVETSIGITNVTAGILEVDGSLAAGSTLNVATAGTLTGTGTINGKGTVTGSGTIDLGATGRIAGTLTATGGTWTNVGTVGGLVTVSGAATTFTIATGANLTATTGVTIAGGTLAGLGTVTGSLTDMSATSFAFGGVIAGAGAKLTMNNAASTLTLTNVETYAGVTTISAGTLQVGNGSTGSLAGTSGVTVAGTGSLALDLVDLSTFGKNVNLSAAGAALKTIQAGTVTLTGVLSGSGVLDVEGPGTTILQNTQLYTGATNVLAGTLQLDGSTAAGGTVNVGPNGTLIGAGTIKGKGTLTGSGIIDFSAGGRIAGALTKTSGNWNGSGTVAGLVTSSSGAFTLGANANLTALAGLALAGGTLAGSGTLTGSLTDTSSTSEIFGGVVAGAAATVTMNKASTTLTLIGTNTYGGATIVTAGTLQVGDGAATGASLGTGTVTTATAGTLTTDLANGETFSKAVVDNGHVIATGTTNSYSVSGLVSGTGNFTKTGANTVTITGANTYKGGTVVSAGTLLVDNTTGSGTGSGPVTINSGATAGGTGTLGGAVALNSGGILFPGADSLGAAGSTLHATSLMWNGGGTLQLQLGATGDELVLTGALTKGSAGAYNLDIVDTGGGITLGTFTLATFASTTFAVGNFNVELPGNYVGQLIVNAKSLVLDVTAGSGQQPAQSDSPDTLGSSESTDMPTPNVGFTSNSDPESSLSVTPTPEPGSMALLAFGGVALLGWRRRRAC